jgi:acylphosphatase
MAEGPVRAHVVVSGVVQGVFFRANTRDEAVRRGLNGWVRNLPTGEVEAAFEGPEPAVRDMLAWVGRGPSRAVVERVETTWEDPTGEAGFRMRY